MDWWTVGDVCVYVGLPVLLLVAIVIDSILDGKQLVG